MRSTRLRRFALSLVILFAASGARAQTPAFPPTELKNLKVFPSSIPVRALLDTMGTFTRALGVRCAFCHAGGDTVPVARLDFQSDAKPQKLRAREMLRMVRAIDGDFLSKMAGRVQPPVTVSCATCHRGVALPRPLQQVLMMAYDSGGVNGVLGTYGSLRAQYYGRAAYDFGEVPLSDVADSIRLRGKIADAVRVHHLNMEENPTSTFALRQAAAADVLAGDTLSALQSLERALTINPRDNQAQAALTKLRTPPAR